MGKKEVLWADRKRNFLGQPWTFTRYYLSEERLIIDIGLFRRVEDEVRLYRILDISLRRTLWDRILGTGSIHCISSDRSCREFDLKRVKIPGDVKELLSELIEEARDQKRIGLREVLSDQSDAVLDEEMHLF
ncbi:MAG: PH domain-containing protein [Oscillospiraceae bacterium]|nr:PH domain-containing protein [Oscillospiraceae bacterium]